MGTRIWSSPRGTASVELDAKGTFLRFESDGEWLELVRTQLRLVAMLDGEIALPLQHDTIEESGEQNLSVLVARFEPARRRADRVMSVPRAASFVVQLADLVRAHHASGGEGVLGPFDPALVVETDAGDRLVAPGMERLIQQHDSSIRGMKGGGRIVHTRITHDQLRARDRLGVPDEVTSLAVLAIELVSGKEPYPTDSELTYMSAVTKGQHAPLDTLVPRLTRPLRHTLERALSIDASARPTLEALRSALLEEPGVAELSRQAAPSSATIAKPWWKLW
ncbi:MAG: hypothetical protein J0L92_27195 [Deltaproteobacteria bacterium]|nr:hypothetical protein [Deltaproteobacteria bacterium]